MAKNANAINATNAKAIGKEAYDYAKRYATAYCQLAAAELTETAKKAIQRFYDDYKPVYYNRTFDLLNNSYTKYYRNTGRVIYGGVYINSNKMQDYPNGDGSRKPLSERKTSLYTSAEDVLNRVWRYGYRGKAPITTPPPLLDILEKRIDPDFRQTLSKWGHTQAQKHKYNHIQGVWKG